MDRRTVIAVVCTIATLVAASIVAIRGMPHGVFLTLAAIFSGFVLTLYSLAVSHVNDQLEPAQMVAASSALLLLNGTAAAIGPLLAGSLIAVFGPQAYFATLATLTGALTVYDLWRKSRRRAVHPARKGRFITAQPQGMTGQLLGNVEANSTNHQPDGNGVVGLDSSGSIRTGPIRPAAEE